LEKKFWKVACDMHGIGGDGEYCGGNNVQLGRINLIYHEASGGKDAPRALLFDFEPGVIGAATLRRRSASSSAMKNLVNQNAFSGSILAKVNYKKAGQA